MTNSAEVEEGIAGFLDSLKRDGDYESSGHFSLDSKTSLDKLKKFRLNNPAELVLHLVACATYRGATRIQIELAATSLRMAFDGNAFSKTEMESVFSSYFVAEHSPANLSRSSLAIALQTVQSLDPDFVVFESWKGGQGQIMQLYEEKVWLETLERQDKRDESESFQYCCYELRENFWNYCLPSFSQAGKAEGELFRGRCAFGPARVWLNGRMLQARIQGMLFLFAAEGTAPFLPGVVPGTPVRSAPFWGTVQVLQPKSQFYTVPPAEILWVVAGVAYRDTTARDFPSGLLMTVHAPDLRKDLSHSQVLDDELMARRRDELRDAVRALILTDDRFEQETALRVWADPKPKSKPIVRRRTTR